MTATTTIIIERVDSVSERMSLEAPTLSPFAPASPDDLDQQHELGQFLTLASDTSPLIPLPIRCGEGDMASLFQIHQSEAHPLTR